jgi:hypothetical protein
MLEILTLWKEKLQSGDKYYVEKDNFCKYLVKKWIIKDKRDFE